MKLTTRLAYALLPPQLWSLLQQELVLTQCRWMQALLPGRRELAQRMARLKGLQLHLGCGERAMPGWVNIDGFPIAGADLQWDLRHRLPFSNASATRIYSEHVLEHLHKEDAQRLLGECWRLLVPGGRVRLGVPDAELYLRSYALGQSEFFASLRHLGGAVWPLETPMEVVNQMFRMGGSHHFAWDFPTLHMALEQAGFAEVERWAPGQASCAELCLDDPAHAFETLYVEAVRLPLARSA